MPAFLHKFITFSLFPIPPSFKLNSEENIIFFLTPKISEINFIISTFKSLNKTYFLKYIFSKYGLYFSKYGAFLYDNSIVFQCFSKGLYPSYDIFISEILVSLCAF